MSPAAHGAAVPPAPRMTLTVAAVARRLGVAPATLRTWDRRYGLGPSEHTAGAHRRYSSADLARLVVMRRLTLEGVAPAEAARIAATTAVADGGFALASVSTIPPAVIEAAVTDAVAIAGPTSGLASGIDFFPAGDPAGDPVGGTDRPGRAAGTADESEDAESRPVHGARNVADEAAEWAVASLADRFAEEVRTRGVAPAWDTVLRPALATRDAAMCEAVARALAALPVAAGDRAVLLAGLDAGGEPAGRGPVLLAAAAALSECGAGARSVGDGVPVRLLTAAVRRGRPPAVLLHREAGGPAEDGLGELLRVRPAPLVVLLGDGWSEDAGGQLPGCVRAADLHDAVTRCVGAVEA